MATHRILVVDDEANLVRLVRSYLEREGYMVTTAADGPGGLAAARLHRPDLIVLDVMLPGLDGVEVLRELRRESDVYVLMLTARAEEVDKLIGLSVGADDYMTKPFSPRELVARIKTILRRQRGPDGAGTALHFPGLRIEPEKYAVWKNGEPLPLTPIEFTILHTLAGHPGRVFTREQIIERAWGMDYFGEDRVVDVHIGNIRKKLETDPARPLYIHTVRGVGYKFDARES